jgi:(S)-2-hydroxyglutarate dehydrogenase
VYDVGVIGGGIVALATAVSMLEMFPGSSVVVLEKEDGVGRHQTGHNSGVIHAGIYYAPGSLKARLCREGAEATKAFCTENGIPFETPGKLLVATTALELERMHDLEERAGVNGIACERLSAAELVEREPKVVGLGALFVPSTGIVDYRLVCEALRQRVLRLGGEVELGARVDHISETPSSVEVRAGERSWVVRQADACAGLQADRVARLAGLDPEFRIVPFRGEYYQLPVSQNDIVHSLIYPIPDPELPFLGIHLTRMINGRVTVGPNAVLGLSREGYRKGALNGRDIGALVAFPGFWRVVRANLRSGAVEMRNSLWRRGYLDACRKYCPSLTIDDLLPYEAGIRAQAVHRDGSLEHDFLFAETDRTVHVCNAPSPAATSAIPIGRMIADRVASQRSRLPAPVQPV